MQGFIYAALIAAAGVSGAGLGGAAALGLFKLTDQLLQGKDIRSAIFQATKTGALAAGASTVGDLIRGGETATDVAGGATDTAVTIDAPPNSIEQIISDFDGKLSTDEMRFITDNGQQGVPQNIIDQYNAQLPNMYDEGGLELANYKPGQPLSSEQMDAILDMQNQDALPNDVNDQFNAQLDSHLKGETVPDAQTAADMKDAGVETPAGEKVEVLDNPVRGDTQTATSRDALIQDGDTVDRRLSKGSVRVYNDVENSAPGRPAKYTITVDDDGNYVKTYTRPMGADASGGGVNTASATATADPDEVGGASGADRSATAQSGSVQSNVDSAVADMQRKAELVAPSGTGEGIVVRDNIPITDTAQIEEFNRLFPGTQAMSPEATEWLRTNVEGAAEKLDAKAAAQAERLRQLSPQQLARRNALLQSGHSTADALTEHQITKLFIACAYRQNLMEAPGVLSNLKKQIGKGVTALGQKARQVGTNITTKVTADKIMKAWNKAGKPTDSVQIAQFLINTMNIDGAVLQKAFQTAGIKMPDLKKIASDDPVVSLAQKINAQPSIKKQVLAYLNAVT